MKIAGRKNDGAWYRTNIALGELDEDSKAALRTQIGALNTIQDAFQDLVDLAIKSGQDPDAVFFVSVDEWANALTNGVPRQTYMGVLSYDTYTEGVGTGGKKVWRKDHEESQRLFAGDLRTLYKKFIFGRRAMLDLQNTKPRSDGNPGGIADVNKLT